MWGEGALGRRGQGRGQSMRHGGWEAGEGGRSLYEGLGGWGGGMAWHLVFVADVSLLPAVYEIVYLILPFYT